MHPWGATAEGGWGGARSAQQKGGHEQAFYLPCWPISEPLTNQPREGSQPGRSSTPCRNAAPNKPHSEARRSESGHNSSPRYDRMITGRKPSRARLLRNTLQAGRVAQAALGSPGLLETNIMRCSFSERDLTKWIRIPPAMAGAWADAGRTDHRKQNMRTDTGRVSGHNSVAIRGFSVVGEYADGQLLVGRPPTEMRTGDCQMHRCPCIRVQQSVWYSMVQYGQHATQENLPDSTSAALPSTLSINGRPVGEM